MPIALVDCNNFYVSCERVFNPKIACRPVVVLSNNDGCVVSRSDEAKALEIKMGVPAFKIAPLIRRENVAVRSSNYALYGDMSQRVMNTLSQFAPEMEVYSIDEAFLDFSGFAKSGLTEYGHKIRNTVRQWTGLPVSIGIAETKTLAKIANKIAKKSKKVGGVFDLTASPYLEKALSITDVGDVWGVGRRYAKFLRKYGIENALDLSRAEDSWVKKHMSVVGLRMVRELRGIPCISMESAPPAKKEICVSRSFGKPVRSLLEMQEAVSVYTTRAAEKLRAENSAAGVIMVFMMTNRFKDEPQYSRSTIVELPVQTDCTQELIRYALQGVEKIFRRGYSFKKAGVVLARIVPENQIQTDLFDTRNRAASKKLMNALDAVNVRMGRDTLKYAASGLARNWKTLAEKRSPRYTTRWSELGCAYLK
ncbi:Y-family DNA polymerase [Candidatus Latescibacterota bacterium]